MIDRHIISDLNVALDRSPAVILTGPRQVGKTTLALEIGKSRKGLYVDLERPSDLAKLQNFEQFCRVNEGSLVILDEVQRAPEIFATLRGVIDERRREGKRHGQFLLLGSASLDLLRQSSESLAGRVAHIELQSIDTTEVPKNEFHKLFLRGGFPESFLASTDLDSLTWRQDFIRTYLERDVPQFRGRMAAETLRRFWTMIANSQGQLFNASAIARGLDVSAPTASHYCDVMVDLLLFRRLAPWSNNLGKRLTKSPKIFIRDSGLCHALLGIGSVNALLGHPVIGSSFEGLVIETIIALSPPDATFNFYRSAAGAEIDLVISFSSGKLWAVEIKLSEAPRLSKGFHLACSDLNPTRKIVIHTGDTTFLMKDNVEAISIHSIGGLFK